MGINDLNNLPELTGEQKKELDDLRAQYSGYFQVLGDCLAGFADLPKNEAWVAAQILDVLQTTDLENLAAQTGLAMILGYGSFNEQTALAVAHGMYDWDLEHGPGSPDPVVAQLSGFTDPLTGAKVRDPNEGGLRILLNNPGAATKFFTDPQVGSSTVTVNGATAPVNNRLQWVMNRAWADGGISAGLALYAASVPAPGQPASQAQAQVASQAAGYAAWCYQELALHGTGFGLGPGLARGWQRSWVPTRWIASRSPTIRASILIWVVAITLLMESMVWG